MPGLRHGRTALQVMATGKRTDKDGGSGLWASGSWAGGRGLKQLISDWTLGLTSTPGLEHHPLPPPPTLRCELSVEKSTVLQSELESCKELQELEPENKCEARSPEEAPF